ncbi:hypothetical protein XPA_005328 [Xanthoria parietina]
MVQYIDTTLVPAPTPSGHPKIIVDSLQTSPMQEDFNVIDAVATFLYKSDYLAKFLDVETYRFVDVQRLNVYTRKVNLCIERRRRCITCWSSENCIPPDDPINNSLTFSFWKDGSWKLTQAYSSIDPPEGQDERTRVHNVCRTFADGIMFERKWEEGDNRLIFRAEIGDGPGTAARGY